MVFILQGNRLKSQNDDFREQRDASELQIAVISKEYRQLLQNKEVRMNYFQFLFFVCVFCIIFFSRSLILPLSCGFRLSFRLIFVTNVWLMVGKEWQSGTTGSSFGFTRCLQVFLF